MGWHIDDFHGERVDAETATDTRLAEIREHTVEVIRRGGIREWWEQQLVTIDEELHGRSNGGRSNGAGRPPVCPHCAENRERP